MPSGTVKNVLLDRGFGFLATDAGDLFFHAKALSPAITFDDRLIGRVVSFDHATVNGRQRAIHVREYEDEDDIPQVQRHG